MEAHLKALALVSIAVVIALTVLILLISISDGKVNQVPHKHMGSCYQRLSPADFDLEMCALVLPYNLALVH
jgi:hypothetical protein